MHNLKLLLTVKTPLIEEGIINILSKHIGSHLIIDTAKTNEELYHKIKLSPPHALIIDLELFELGKIIEFFLEVKRMACDIKMLVLVEDAFLHNNILKIFDHDNINYVHRSCEKIDFIEALNATLTGRKYLNYQLINRLVALHITDKHISRRELLTSTEMEIVKLILSGYTSNEIAVRKQVSIHTVNSHRKNIFRKLRIKNSLGMIKYIASSGIIK